MLPRVTWFTFCLLLLLKGGEARREFHAQPGQLYQLLVTATDPATLPDTVQVTVSDSHGPLLSKPLHKADGDLFAILQPRAAGKVVVDLKPPSPQLKVTWIHAGPAASEYAQLASAGHNSWLTAEPIQLGRTVYASADDRPYIPAPSEPKQQFTQLMAGIHWYKLDYKGPADRLVHFNIDILDRDVPAGIAIFTVADGKPVEYTRGRERYETERSTNFHGLQKFEPRILVPGAYYIRVMGNHPFFKLETPNYPPPPYDDPRLAIRAAMDYIVRKGDSWHANVPRKGAVARRDSNPLQETKLCISCHPTHFSMRGAMFALEAGYPVHARSSVQFLAERLYNNPRPIYGKPDASWARMIHAPGNVFSRLAYLTSAYDRLLNSERREELYRGIAAYLEMYWPGMTEPSHESNGNLPRISGFEVALHNAMLFEDLHKRTGEPKYKDLRGQIERVALAGKPVDMLDLCWKLDLLVWLGRDNYAAQIAELRDQIFSHQQPDGRWPMPFGMEEIQYDFRSRKVQVRKLPTLAGQSGPRASDFQTWHAIYALARAGVTLDDPRLAKAVKLCLSKQTPSGAWQGNPDYKNFDTPFRDTQYALMALSTLYEDPKGRGLPAPPSRFNESSAVETIAALDQHWDRPADPITARIRKQLDSRFVLVRYQAAVTLGRFADAGSLDALTARLADDSKLVQRAAAWALRQIGSRNSAAREAAIASIAKALDSPHERTRWGATRIFNQHFKYLSEEWSLGRRLIHIASADPSPAVKTAAVQALYQWWYWDHDASHKEAIELALLDGLGREEHPIVRRNFIEAYYLVLDDNTRYLYGSWIPRVKRAEDKHAIEQGHKENVRLQALRYRDAMRKANPLGRDGLLRALYTHHIREGLPDISALSSAAPPDTVEGHWVNGYRFAALYDPLTGGSAGFTSIGNDAEPPVFYADSGPIMNEAFLAALDQPAPEHIRGAMRALSFLRGIEIGTQLADRILALVTEAPADVRSDVAQVAKSQLRGKKLDTTRLAHMAAEGDAITLDVLAALGAKVDVSERLARTPVEDRAFPNLVSLAAPSQAEFVRAGFYSKRPQPQQSALRFHLANKLPVPDDYPEAQGPFPIGGALSVIGSLDYSAGRYKDSMPEIRRILLAGLNSEIHTLRAQALTVLRSIQPLHQDAAILDRVRALKRDPEAAVRASALAFETSKMARSGRGARAADIADYFYFKEHVEPILLKKAADGQSCAACHANHTLLKLQDADEYGVVTLAQSRANYNAILSMINVQDPEQSLLLNKPLAPLDDAGIGDSQALSHGGGIRWSDARRSPEFLTILRWIQGARL